MSTTSGESALGSRLGTVVTAVAILFSIAVMVVLVSTDVLYARQLRANRTLASIVPAAGTLVGQNALDGSEWVPAKDGKQVVLLFGITEAGQAGDMEFWRDIASRSREAIPDIQFVGLCLTEPACRLANGSTNLLTLLKSMDPVQTHALATGIKQGQAFVFRGPEAVGMLPIKTDRQAFSAQIASLFRPKAKVGGA